MYKRALRFRMKSHRTVSVLLSEPILSHRQATRFVMETTIRRLRLLVFLVICVLTASVSVAGRPAVMAAAAARQGRGGQPPGGPKDLNEHRMSSIGRLA